jgi:hypothetical protein
MESVLKEGVGFKGNYIFRLRFDLDKGFPIMQEPYILDAKEEPVIASKCIISIPSSVDTECP